MALRNRSSAVQILALVREAVEPALFAGLTLIAGNPDAALAYSPAEREIRNALASLQGKGELDLKQSYKARHPL